MYHLTKESETKRTYQSTITGTEVITSLLYTGTDGEKFWGFEDLFSIPTQRKIAAQRITDLFAAGVTKEEIQTSLSETKAFLKANDYDNAITTIINLENNLSHSNDITKQANSLAAIYVLTDTERIDTINQSVIMSKIERWRTFEDEQSFFLTWLMNTIDGFTKLSGQLSKIVSKMSPTN